MRDFYFEVEMYTKLLSEIEENEFIIPKLKVVYYGRKYLFKNVCYRCHKSFISRSGNELFCSYCVDSQKDVEVLVDTDKYRHLVRVEQANGLVYKRKTKNYLKVYKRDDYTCQYCGADSDLTIDHIQPFSSGGSNDLDNLVVACRHCNSVLNDKVFDSFELKRKFLWKRLKINNEFRDKIEENNKFNPIKNNYLRIPIGKLDEFVNNAKDKSKDKMSPRG